MACNSRLQALFSTIAQHTVSLEWSQTETVAFQRTWPDGVTSSQPLWVPVLGFEKRLPTARTGGRDLLPQQTSSCPKGTVVLVWSRWVTTGD